MPATRALPPFASDNYAPVHPEVLAAIAEANTGYAVSYCTDEWNDRLDERCEEIFGWGAMAFMVLTGTGANVISLMAASPRWGGVVASEVAHAHTDENGAPERVGGLKLLTRPVAGGKLTPADVESWGAMVGDVHRAQPTVVTVTQGTEVGTVYRAQELEELCDTAHDLGFVVHLDGSRLANAAAYLGTGLRDLTTEVGVDIVSLGAAKNGGMIGEAVVVMGPGEAPCGRVADRRRQMAQAVPFLRKSTMQLASKGRFVAAQLLALLGEPATTDDKGVPLQPRLWLRNAEQANAMAALLRAGIEERFGTGAEAVVRPTQPTEANAVFATLPRTAADRLRKVTRFYNWGPGETPDRVEARWMCAWSTTPQDVAGFVAALSEAVNQ